MQSFAQRPRHGSRPGNIPGTHRTAVTLQAKTTTSRPGDPLELEADRMAERVAGATAITGQRSCACGGGCPACRGGSGAEARVQPAADGEVPAMEVPPEVEAVTRAPGTTLDPATHRLMESRFGHGFEQVRIHAGPRAATAAAAIQARAYTLGQHIVFGAGQYAPHTPEGRRLLAHELTHTVQQGRGTGGGDAVAQRVPTGPQVLGGAIREPVSLVTPDITIIPDILDYATIAIGLSLGRALTAAERAILQPVYGPHLNYTVIRICENTVCSPDGIPRTVGNLIAAPAGGISNTTLVHEAAHIWQHQNGIRYAYIPAALLSQFGAWLLTGSRNAAYNWQMYYNNHIPWMAWNPEAQAAYIEHHMALPPWYVWGTGGFLPVP